MSFWWVTDCFCITRCNERAPRIRYTRVPTFKFERSQTWLQTILNQKRGLHGGMTPLSPHNFDLKLSVRNVVKIEMGKKWIYSSNFYGFPVFKNTLREIWNRFGALTCIGALVQVFPFLAVGSGDKYGFVSAYNWHFWYIPACVFCTPI